LVVGSNPTARAKFKTFNVSKFKNYIDETIHEMRHEVSWPTWKELQSNTIIVVVASLIFAVLIFVMDFLFGISGEEKTIWKGLLGFIYQMFN
jgi:preprotein translocase subunit SecE